MKRIERVVVDECIGQTSALPGQLRSRLGDGPIQFVFLATQHPGIPDRPQQVPELKETVQQEVSCLLVAWMRAMVRQESTELGNHEQDKR